jgi:hypothetical protein
MGVIYSECNASSWGLKEGTGVNIFGSSDSSHAGDTAPAIRFM